MKELAFSSPTFDQLQSKPLASLQLQILLFQSKINSPK